MPNIISEVAQQSLTIEIGGMPVRVNSTDRDFLGILQNRYAGYLTSATNAEIDFDIEMATPGNADPDAPVRVAQRGGRWTLTRGDFRAEWEPTKRRGWIRQTANPYSIDAVLRIVHTLVLAKQGGFLVHSASAIRNGKAYLFAGVSEAGKTTISRLAPSDVTLLTDEISYVRKGDDEYVAALYLLSKGRENRIDRVPAGEAARGLLANLLFFAEDEELVQAAFHAAFEFVSHVPVSRLTFFPDARIWELIR